MDMDDAARCAFLHFYHEDYANAAMHLAQVKFSPITFAMAELHDIMQREQGLAPIREAEHVLSHRGEYELDPGR